MGKYNKAIITDSGNALMTRALAGEITLEFTHAKTSGYVYPEGTNFTALTDMEGIRQSVLPSEIQVVNDSLINIRVLFGNEDIPKAYLIHNIGLYAKSGDGEVLFSISTAVMPDEMPAYSGIAPSSYIYNIQPKVTAASNMQVTVNPAGTATALEVWELKDEIRKCRTDIGDKTTMTTTSKDNLVSAINELKQETEEAKKSVSDGKGKIAAAVTRKKVATAAADSFHTMAENIDKIKLGSGNATPNKVLSGATFTNDSGIEQTGTMPGRGGTSNLAIDKEPFMYEGELVQYMPTGYYAGTVVEGFAETKHRGTIPLDKVVSATGVSADKIMANHQVCGVTGTATADATAGPEHILQSKTAYKNGSKITGTMLNKSGTTQWWSGYETVSVQPVEGDPEGQASVTVPNRYGAPGYYDSSSSVFGYVAHLSAGNIKHNVMVGRMGGDSSNCIKGTFTSDANITPDTVLTGKRGYSQGTAVNGAIPIYNTAATQEFGIHTDYFYERFPYGYYQNANGDGTSEARIPVNSFTKGMGITAEKIVSGQEICGVVGTGGNYKKLDINTTAICSRSGLEVGTWKNLFPTSKDTIVNFTFEHNIGKMPSNVSGYFLVTGNYGSTSSTSSDENFRIVRGYSVNSDVSMHYYMGNLPFEKFESGTWLYTAPSNTSYSGISFPGGLAINESQIILQLESGNQAGSKGVGMETRADTFKVKGCIFYQ